MDLPDPLWNGLTAAGENGRSWDSWGTGKKGQPSGSADSF